MGILKKRNTRPYGKRAMPYGCGVSKERWMSRVFQKSGAYIRYFKRALDQAGISKERNTHPFGKRAMPYGCGVSK